MVNSREKHRRHKKERYYWQLPRRKQRDNFIRFRQKIRYLSPIFGGQFMSPHHIDEPSYSPEDNQWADIYFLGTDKVTVWNTTILTAADAFWGAVELLADKKVFGMLTEEEWENEFRRRSRYETMDEPATTFEKFGGLNLMEYWDKIENEIILYDPPVIFESFSTDRSYFDGIGLTMIVHVPEINRLTIEEAISRFRQIGETDWKASEPVPRDQLPSTRRSYSLSSMSRRLR